MDKETTKTERTSLDDRKRRSDAMADPHKFYPRPEDVLKDGSLSKDEKRSLLNNWRVHQEGRGGVEPGTHAVDTEDDSSAMDAAVAEALAKLEADKKA